MLRPHGNTSSHPRQRCVVAYRVILQLAWGPPPEGRPLACHVGCDNKSCLNPAHGRWGSHKDNARENKLLRAFKAALDELPSRQRAAFIAMEHPCRPLLDCQGFWRPAV
jgi:hypothetical protein